MSSNKTKWNSLGDFLKAKEEREKEQPAPENSTPVTPVTEVAAPTRDFARVANSIVRDVIPSGVFTGKCKQLYDYLYSHTRGAIVPVRSVRLPTDRVMKGAGMTRHTFRAHIRRLIGFGLVEVEERPGEHGGNLYTVYLPEEIEKRSVSLPNTNPCDPGDPCDPGHPGHRGLSVGLSTISGESKTFFKTNTEIDDDDAALAGLATVLKHVNKEVTGKELSRAEADRWKEVADVLAAELRIAATRTTVSSVPAFLAEHLRRRLWKIDKKQARAEGRELPDETVIQSPTVDAGKCPDCGGSGWWYPDGEAKGVAKCRHDKLATGV